MKRFLKVLSLILTIALALTFFSGCESQKESGLYRDDKLVLPNNVTKSIVPYTFDYTGYYFNKDNWENNVLYKDNDLIAANTSISGEYIIKNGTKAIVNFAFNNCKSLTDIIIPDSVTNIGDGAFDNCNSLLTIHGKSGSAAERYANENDMHFVRE